MSDQTSRLSLPLLAAAQAQKHVTHNEALLALDALTQLSVLDQGREAPPADAVDGARHLVGATPSAAWAGRGGEIAAYRDGGWHFHVPRAGWRVYIEAEARLMVHDGDGWIDVKPRQADRLGINATAEATTRLAVSSPAVLLNHEGADMRLTLNKAAAANTASLLFQAGFSGRAEFGLMGRDDVGLTVSADGTSFREALIADRATGEVRFPNGFVDVATGLKPLQLLPAPPRDLWRPALASGATPRTYTIAAVSGATVTITAPQVAQIFAGGMRDAAMVRIWNISKSPARAAWVNWDNAAAVFNVHQASDLAGWLPGETLRLGDPDPTGANTLGMVAIDLSNYLFNSFGTVFRQRGLKLALDILGTGGRATLALSGTGAAGSTLEAPSAPDGNRHTHHLDIFTPSPSPISGANLLYVSESLTAPATALTAGRGLRVVGVYV